MKTHYILAVFTLFAFSLIFAQDKQVKMSPKQTPVMKTTVQKSIDAPQSSLGLNSTTTVTYDFTTSATKYHGGPAAAKFVGMNGQDSVFAMIAGDANGDGGVQAEDYISYQTNQGQENYNVADFNLDGAVQAEDYIIYQTNQGKESQVPNL